MPYMAEQRGDGEKNQAQVMLEMYAERKGFHGAAGAGPGRPGFSSKPVSLFSHDWANLQAHFTT